MTRNGNSAKAAGDVTCSSCGEVRHLKNVLTAGSMCRRCAVKIATAAATKSNKLDELERFQRSIQVNGTGCGEWTGTLQTNGYSAFTLSGPARTVRAHRWSYEHHVGPIPEGLQIDHLCRNRRCVNPEHLEAVTARENTRRAMRSHCVNGHEFTPENTYTPADGKRYCRECRRARVRAQHARRANAA